VLGERLVGVDGHDRTDHHGRRSLHRGTIDAGAVDHGVVEHDHGGVGAAAR